MIKTTSCILAACDICGATPENDYDGTSHFESGQEDDAFAEAESADWWTDRTTRLVLCDKRDDAHLAKARQIHDELKAADDNDLTSFLTYWPELDEQGRSETELLAAWHESLPRLDGEAA